METRANHVLIGGFVLVVIAGFFGFVIWLAKVEIDREFNYYHIYFDEAVSGLAVGSDVRYNGIPVGKVTALVNDPNSPSRVQATVEISSATKIHTDTVARLELQGITGVSFVQLGGGSVAAPLLQTSAGDDLPVIQSERSTFKEIFAGAPELINRITGLVSELTKLLNEDNQRSIANILANFDDVTARLARRGPELEALLVDMRGAAAEVRTMTSRMNSIADDLGGTLAVARGTLATADNVLDQDARRALAEVERAGRDLAGLSGEMQKLVTANREPLSSFTQDGLVQFTRFIEEARLLVASTSRLVENIEQDPKQFLFGDQQEGFETK